MVTLEYDRAAVSSYIDFLRANGTSDIASLMINKTGKVTLPNLPLADEAWQHPRSYPLSQEAKWMDVGTRLWYGGELNSVEQWIPGLLSVPDSVCNQGYTHLALHLDTAYSIGAHGNDEFQENIRDACSELGVVEKGTPSRGRVKSLPIFFEPGRDIHNEKDILLIKIPPKRQRDRFRSIYQNDNPQSEQPGLEETITKTGLFATLLPLNISARAQSFRATFRKLHSDDSSDVVIKILDTPDQKSLPDALQQVNFLKRFGPDTAVQPITSGKLYDALAKSYSDRRIIITPFLPNEDLFEFLWRMKGNLQRAPTGRKILENFLQTLKGSSPTYDYYRSRYINVVEGGIRQGLLLRDVRTTNFLLDTPVKKIFNSRTPTGKLLLCDVEHVVSQYEAREQWPRMVDQARRRMHEQMPMRNR